MKTSVFRIMLLFALLLASCAGKNESFSFVQLCDPQLGMGGYVEDQNSFRLAIEKINDMDVDFAVICGDLVHHASDSSFADLQDLLDDFEIPCYLVPGNHDVGNEPTDLTLAFYREQMGEDYYKKKHKGISFIFTNSQLWKSDLGEESRMHHEWFTEMLSGQKKNKRSVVIGHYPLYIKDINEEEGYSNLPVEIRKELIDLFTAHNVVAYLTGHKHALTVNNYMGIQLVSGESTSKNFDGRLKGFRKWDVQADTLIHSFVPLPSVPYSSNMLPEKLRAE